MIVRQLDSTYQTLERHQMVEWEATLGMPVGLYTQQIAGIAAGPQRFDLYQFLALDADPGFQSIVKSVTYARTVERLGRQIHDSLWIGVGKVWEAAVAGDAASIWGALPYTQAFDRANYPDPQFDPQLTIYQVIDAQLDSAIQDFAVPPRPHGGPDTAELIYRGQPPESLATIYTEVAHTLRARYDLHQAGVNPSYYALALQQAQQGISDPRHDWNWYNNGVIETENNATYNLVTGHSAGQLAPSATLINLMHQRVTEGLDSNQDRLDFYFVSTANASGSCDSTCAGFRPGGDTAEPGGGGTSDFNLLNNGAGFRQPYVTWTETQLIVAEAALATASPLLAQRALNTVRLHEVYGADASSDRLASGALACNNGPCLFRSQRPVPATLRNIIEEKYIDLFLSAEVWADYRRTCLPYIAAAPATVTDPVPRVGGLPERFPYGSTIIAGDPNTPNVGPDAHNADSPRVCPSYSFFGTPAAY